MFDYYTTKRSFSQYPVLPFFYYFMTHYAFVSVFPTEIVYVTVTSCPPAIL